jgi:hypothetical protein
MAMTWDDLRRLREQGHRPSLPVAVTTHGWTWRGLGEIGCMVIEHKPGEPFPVDLTEGLSVLLFLNCAQAQAVARLFRSRNRWPASVRSWCACRKELTVAPEASCAA